MKRPTGALVVRDVLEVRVRVARWVGIPTMVVGEAVLAFLSFRGAERFAQGYVDAVHVVAFGFLLLVMGVGLFWLIVAIRIGPDAVYADGVDRRAWGYFLSRSFYTWDEFSAARIEHLGGSAHPLARVTLVLRRGSARFVFSTAHTSTEFVGALERFLETSRVLPIERDGDPSLALG